jgi:hypothetical protein
MARGIDASLIAAFEAENVQPFYAVELGFDSGTLRMWTGPRDAMINGEIYIGTGALLSIGDIEEVSDLSAKGLTVTLSGLSTSIISIALQEPYLGRPARLLFGAINVSTGAIVGAHEMFAGLLDDMRITRGAEQTSVTISIENRLVILQRPNIRRYTSENHKLRYPGDTFFDFVQPLQDKEIAWGRTVS